jgi:hypothetical protein
MSLNVPTVWMSDFFTVTQFSRAESVEGTDDIRPYKEIPAVGIIDACPR